jgi:hypothetical protein
MNSLKKYSVLIVLFFLCIFVLSGCYKLPSEKSLLKLFNENRTEFEALIEVPKGVTYLSADDEKLYKKLGIRYSVVWEHLEDSEQHGIAFSIGDAVPLNFGDGAQREIAYLPALPSETSKKILPSLDQEAFLPSLLFQPIEGNWYLFQETTR